VNLESNGPLEYGASIKRNVIVYVQFIVSIKLPLTSVRTVCPPVLYTHPNSRTYSDQIWHECM
jgi:hypothetical protein